MHERQAHGDVEPVQNVLGVGTHAHLQVANGVAAVGEKRDALIHLQSLRSEHVVKTALRFGIEAADEPEALRLAGGGKALPDNDFEPSVLACPVSRVYVAAVDADDERLR